MTIAGFDPSGGAGILNDIKTFHALNEYGTAVITALTAQNIKRIEDIYPIDPEFIGKEIDLILEQEEVQYVKTGMLYSAEIVEMVASKIKENHLKVVVDPVMVAGSGGSLKTNGIADAIKRYLLPEALIITPNIYEAEKLSGIKITDENSGINAAIEIGKLSDVVITGGHLKGNDITSLNGKLKVLKGELLTTQNTHGSGCTFSAAATAYLNKGQSIEDAIINAGKFTRKSIRLGYKGTLKQFH